MRIFVLMVLVSLTTPVLALVTTPATQDSDLVMVLHVPWNSGEQLVIEAGGRSIGPLGSPVSTLAASDAPDFIQRIRDGGGWALDGALIGALCGVKL